MLALALASSGVARAAGSEVEGRKHARKANHLADINKCKAAIVEYDKALRSLKDPTLFFNRGECHRKTGQAAKAVADYKQFLADLPAAPNRDQVEAQIAALEKVAAASPAARPASASAGANNPAAGAQSPSLRLPPKAARPLPPPSAGKSVERQKESERLAEPDLSGPPPPVDRAARTAVAPAPEIGLLDQGTMGRPVPAEGDSKSRHVWLWVLLGVVVASGAAAGIYLAVNPSKTDTSGGALGNYRF